MQLCNDTITVFNAYVDEDTGSNVYAGTVISGVSWYSSLKTSIDSSGGLKAANVFTVRVPVNADFSAKKYVSPETYDGTNHDTTFTFKNGDIVIKGAVTLSDPRPKALFDASVDVFTVMNITDNRRAPHAPHWKVTGV